MGQFIRIVHSVQWHFCLTNRFKVQSRYMISDRTKSISYRKSVLFIDATRFQFLKDKTTMRNTNKQTIKFSQHNYLPGDVTLHALLVHAPTNASHSHHGGAGVFVVRREHVILELRARLVHGATHGALADAVGGVLTSLRRLLVVRRGVRRRRWHHSSGVDLASVDTDTFDTCMDTVATVAAINNAS